MQVITRDQRCGRCDQLVVARRYVATEIDDAVRQGHLREERKAPRIRIGLREVQQPYARRLQQHLDQRRLGRRAEYHAIDLAGQQRHRRRRVVQLGQLHLLQSHTVRLQQLLYHLRHAGAARADVDVLAAQIRHAVDLYAGTIEQPDRFDEQAAQRHQVIAFRILQRGRAALHESHIGTRFRILQPLQVLERTLGALQPDGDALTREYRRIALGQHFVRAVLLSGGNGDDLGRKRIDHAVRQPGQRQQQHEGRAEGGQQVAQRQGGEFQVLGHGQCE